jgi:hypothetical protein
MTLRFAREPSDTETSSTRRSASLVVALLTLAVAAPAASAKTVTLHYFSKQTSSAFVNPQGQPLGPNSSPAVGDINDNTGIDFVGNHKHHAKPATFRLQQPASSAFRAKPVISTLGAEPRATILVHNAGGRAIGVIRPDHRKSV